MGKLNIAHHKSYHPYRRDNIERVRKDEEEAKLKEAKEEGRMMLADSEARIDMLRDKAGLADKSEKKKRRDDDDMAHLAGASTSTSTGPQLPTTNGHINFFEDLEHNSLAISLKATKKAAPVETEKGVPLAPSEKDLKPWYSARPAPDDEEEELAPYADPGRPRMRLAYGEDWEREREREKEQARKKRETQRKSAHDPLTSITKQLSSRSPSKSQPAHKRHMPPPPIPSSSGAQPEVQARLTRESSERQRALELINRRKREMAGSETPSTVHGGEEEGYGDQFNRGAVEEAKRSWDRRDRRWENDREKEGRKERPRKEEWGERRS
ncbi:hypothetical protein BDQ12DRAFT_683403 [Crucibulum laeve]|uniref:CBF1-interacting co-repressor CIR N-terminal domain-containing protein n=1 Tax=Crucibulum laeve TaxID=68775 RepID=A0A5C3M270_9AGAR|nr:hypothetical protein BDQ12DRAFT_683403 [Crucibulum laeve]